MTATTYFRRALLLPILVPLIASILILMYTRLAWPPIRSDTVATFLAALAISGVYSLIPYGIAAAWLYRQSKREEADWKYWQALWVTPLVVTVLSMLVATALVVPLASRYGLFGAALGTSASLVLTQVALRVAARRAGPSRRDR